MMKKIWNKTNTFLFLQSDKLLQSLVFFSVGLSLYQLFGLGNWELLYLIPASFILKEYILSAYYHRYISHNAWECPKWLEFILLFLSTGFGLGAAIGWASIHREHHSTSDVIGKDPHGPTRSLWDNITIFSRKPSPRYSVSLYKNKLLYKQAEYYWPVFSVIALFWCMTIGVSEYFFILFMLYLQQVSINIIGHIPNVENKMFLAGSDINHVLHHENPNRAKMRKFDLAYYTLIKWFPHKS